MGGETRTTHGHARKGAMTREYIAWAAMRSRCGNPKLEGYKNWGGRGIRVCDRWLNDFSAFLADVGPRPSPKHSLDRVNNDGHYEPGNVRWATREQQNENKRPLGKQSPRGRALGAYLRNLGLAR